MQEPLDASHGNVANDENPLGEPIRVFRAKLVTRIALIVSGAVILMGGIYLLIEWSTIATLPLLLGLMAMVLGYFMGKSMILVCPRGVINVRWGVRQMCRWEDIGQIVDTKIKQGLVTSRRCALVKKNGGRMELHDLGLDDFAGLTSLLRQQAELRGIEWKEERSVKPA